MQDSSIENPEPIQEQESVYPGSTDEIRTEPVNEQKPPKQPFFTFNFNTLLGFILLAGLAILYFLHFTKPASQPVAPLQVQKAGGKSLSVVFVNIDSLNSRYDFVKSLRNNLEGTGKRLQTEVLNEQASLEKEAADFQKQISMNAISEDKAKLIYEQLMERQQKLMEKKERYTQQVAEQEMEMNIRLVDSVTAYLKRFNRQYGFDYIFGYKTAGEILVANDTLDITNAVIEGLNAEFNDRKK